MIKILLADDHQLLREGLRRSFEAAGDDVVGEASTGEEAVALAKALQPEVVLMDLSMPVMDGIEATQLIREQVPGTKVAVLTMHDDLDKTRDAIAAGASAYLSKGTSFTDVRDTVMRVAEGETVLSPALGRSHAHHRPRAARQPGTPQRPAGGNPPGHRRRNEHEAGGPPLSGSPPRRCTTT